MNTQTFAQTQVVTAINDDELMAVNGGTSRVFTRKWTNEEIQAALADDHGLQSLRCMTVACMG